jgi:hypothetical protein
VLFGAGDRHFVMQKPPFYRRQLRPGINAAGGALGEDHYQQGYERGQKMSVAEATDFLLGD